MPVYHTAQLYTIMGAAYNRYIYIIEYKDRNTNTYCTNLTKAVCMANTAIPVGSSICYVSVYAALKVKDSYTNNYVKIKRQLVSNDCKCN